MAAMMMSQTAQSKTQDVGGRVIDQNGEPLGFVSIALLSADSTYIQGATSDENGAFMIQTTDACCILRLSYIGYRTQYVNVKGSDLGTIQMEEDQPLLSEIIVKGQMPKTKLTGNSMVSYDKLAVNVIVENSEGGISSCDIPFTDDIQQFNRDYLSLTAQAANECKSSFLNDYMVIGTSAMIQTELDCIVNQYTDQFCNPMVMWGKYRKGMFKTTMPVSFQFHHVQMDGGHASLFLDILQKEILFLC